MTKTTDPSVELAGRFDLNQILPAEVAQAILLELSHQVAALHAGGRIHRMLTPAAMEIDSDGSVRLCPPTPVCWLGRSPIGGAWLPPELRNVAPFEMPSILEAAIASLQRINVELAPQQIDIYQLGALLCRFLTGESSEDYLRSLAIKQRVPASLQPVIERALGCDGKSRFESVDQFSAELSEVSLDHSIDQANASQPESDPPKSQSDTTPSMFKPRGGSDTTVSAKAAASKRPPAESIPFHTLGHFEILSRIGQGGMGDVYLGYERSLDRKVAIKVLPAEFARQPDFVRRFRAEATAAAKLVHPNVIQIFFIGETDGFHFFSMQYIEGESLAELLKRQRRLDLDDCLEIIEQVFAGLAAAHKQGLVHRDIKPGNVLLDRQHHRALLADFGLVKSLQAPSNGQTVTGVILGTADYMPPEQARGKEVDHRADLYSMGVLMYQMISGRLPFAADTATALIFQHVYEQPPPLGELTPKLPQQMIDIVDKLLRKSPDDRYQSAEDVLADLQLVRGGEPRATTQSKKPLVPSATGNIYQAPASDEVNSLLDVDSQTDARTGWWDRAVRVIRRHSPVALEALQNTQQQVDGAIDDYEHRQRKLNRLVREAESVLADLRSQAEAHRAEIDRNPEAEKTVNELDRQAADQEDQLEKIRLELAQAKVTHRKLITQRDLLNARLLATKADAQVRGGGRQRSSQKKKWIRSAMIVAASLLVLAGMVRTLRSWTAAKLPLPTRTVVSAPKTSTPVIQPTPKITASEVRPKPVVGAMTSACDLLQQLDFSRDVIRGNWKKEGTSLVGTSWGKIYLPTPLQIPDHYRLNFTLKRVSGDDTLVLGFVMSGRCGQFAFDCHGGSYSGLYVDGHEPKANGQLFRGTSLEGALFKNDEPAEVTMTVHPKHLLVTLNDRLIVDWYGDPNRLYLHSEHGLPNRESLFLATSNATFQIDAATLTPIDPEVEPARQDRLHEVIDVLSAIDPGRDAVSGVWKVSGTTLHTPETQMNRISIPVAVPEEYTISAVVELPTSLQGEPSLTFGLVAGQAQVQTMFVNGNRLGLDMLDGKRWTDNQTTIFGQSLKPGVPEQFECTVTRQGIRLDIGGRTMIDWQGDFGRLGISPDWAVPDARHLFLGASGHLLLREIKLGPPKPAPALPEHAPFAIGRPVELLTMIDPAKNALTGTWSKDSQSLRVQGNSEHSFLVLPNDVPDEYKFTAVLEREPGGSRNDDGLFLKLPIGPYMADVGIDVMGSTISGVYLDGLNIDRNEAYAKTRVIPTTGRQEIVCYVRKTGLKIVTPDRTVFDWVGNIERLEGRFLHSTTSSKIAIGSLNSRFRFDRLEVEPLPTSKFSSTTAVGREGKLLPIIAPLRDSRKGAWKRETDGLINPPISGARLRIPVVPPERYVLIANLERRRGTNQVCFGLVVDGHACSVAIDVEGKLAGLERIDDKPIGDSFNLTRRNYPEALLPPNQTVEVRCYVLPDTVIVLCGNKEVVRWHGDPRRLSPPPASLPPNYSEMDRSHLWLGTSDSEFVFRDLRLHELNTQQIHQITGSFSGIFPTTSQMNDPLTDTIRISNN